MRGEVGKPVLNCPFLTISISQPKGSAFESNHLILIELVVLSENEIENGTLQDWLNNVLFPISKIIISLQNLLNRFTKVHILNQKYGIFYKHKKLSFFNEKKSKNEYISHRIL